VLLIGDVDMLYDNFCVRQFNMFGQTMVQPTNDNLNFMLNMVEQLTGSEALIGLRSRGRYGRPFEKVLDLERKAQQKWKVKEADLQRELQSVQGKLSALLADKPKNQKYIISPAMATEIKAFEKQKFDAQQHLREVRKNLRKDIDNLGLRIKVINIAGVPIVVAFLGLLFGWYRRNKQQP